MIRNDYPEIIHAADHIRDFIRSIGRYTVISELIGINRKTIMMFANGLQSTNIDYVEAYLNEIGYTLVVQKIGGRR